MDSAWREDIKTFTPHRTVGIAYGTAKVRSKILSSKTDFVIINYDGMKIVEDDIRASKFDLIIVDEATHYKNAQTVRWKTLNRIMTDDTRLWMLTGTPAAQSPVDAFGLAKLVNSVNVPRSTSVFRDQTMRRVTNFKWVPRDYANKIVHKALQPAIRFTKEECLDLPPMVYVKREVELTRQQKKYYAELKTEMIVQAGSEEITAINAAVSINKLLQISAGAVYTDNKVALEFDIKNRYNVLREVIDESDKKVIIFVPYKHVIQVLSQKLIADGINSAVISGDVSSTDRTDIFKRFQTTPNPRVLVIQPRTAAHGVTLTKTDIHTAMIDLYKEMID